MPKFARFIKGKELKYTVREFTLIVLGILFALAINNWNEDRKEYHKETDLLQNLNISLQSNLTSINHDIAYSEETLDNLLFLIDHLKNNKPYSKNLDTYFGEAIRTPLVLADKSVYENLKALGTDIITNDSIRVKLSSLFEYDYKYLEEMGQITISHLVHNVQPFYGKHFEDFNKFENATPIEYKFIANSQEYIGILEWLKLNKELELPVYKRTRNKLVSIIDLIDEELKDR